MADLATRTFDGDGVRLTADVLGDEANPAILMFHGGGQTRHSWGTTMANLAGDGWYVASVDLRGHGESDWAPDGDYRLQRFASDVIAVAANFDRPVLIGASLGGVSSLAALGAAGSSLARGLVLVDVAPRIEVVGADRIGRFMLDHMESGFASLDEVADAIAAYNPHRKRPSNLDGLRKNVRWRDGRWYWHWDPQFISGGMGSPDETRLVDRKLVFNADTLEDAARSLTIPVLLIRGRESDLLSVEGAQMFLDLVPHAEFVDVAGAGHMVAGDRNDIFNDAIESFVARLGDHD